MQPPSYPTYNYYQKQMQAIRAAFSRHGRKCGCSERGRKNSRKCQARDAYSCLKQEVYYDKDCAWGPGGLSNCSAETDRAIRRLEASKPKKQLEWTWLEPHTSPEFEFDEELTEMTEATKIEDEGHEMGESIGQELKALAESLEDELL